MRPNPKASCAAELAAILAAIGGDQPPPDRPDPFGAFKRP
jgi:hypothetical protein